MISMGFYVFISIFIFHCTLSHPSHPKTLRTQCPPGHHVIIKDAADISIDCAKCPFGTYSNVSSNANSCVPCTVCPKGDHVTKACTSTADAQCSHHVVIWQRNRREIEDALNEADEKDLNDDDQENQDKEADDKDLNDDDQGNQDKQADDKDLNDDDQENQDTQETEVTQALAEDTEDNVLEQGQVAAGDSTDTDTKSDLNDPKTTSEEDIDQEEGKVEDEEEEEEEEEEEKEEEEEEVLEKGETLKDPLKEKNNENPLEIEPQLENNDELEEKLTEEPNGSGTTQGSGIMKEETTKSFDLETVSDQKEEPVEIESLGQDQKSTGVLDTAEVTTDRSIPDTQPGLKGEEPLLQAVVESPEELEEMVTPAALNQTTAETERQGKQSSLESNLKEEQEYSNDKELERRQSSDDQTKEEGGVSEDSGEGHTKNTSVSENKMPVSQHDVPDGADKPEEVTLKSGTDKKEVSITTEKIPTLKEMEANDPEIDEDGSGDEKKGQHGKDNDHHTHSHEDGDAHTGASHHHGDSHEDKVNKQRTAIIVGVAVGGVALFTIAFFASQQCKNKRRNNKETNIPTMDATEMAPLSPNISNVFVDIETRNPNGLYRHGPKIGPPSPRMYRKSEGKFQFPESQKNQPLDVPRKKHLDSTQSVEDDETEAPSPSDKLLPGNSTSTQPQVATPKIVIQSESEDDDASTKSDSEGQGQNENDPVV